MRWSGTMLHQWASLRKDPRWFCQGRLIWVFWDVLCPLGWYQWMILVVFLGNYWSGLGRLPDYWVISSQCLLQCCQGVIFLCGIAHRLIAKATCLDGLISMRLLNYFFPIIWEWWWGYGLPSQAKPGPAARPSLLDDIARSGITSPLCEWGCWMDHTRQGHSDNC